MGCGLGERPWPAPRSRGRLLPLVRPWKRKGLRLSSFFSCAPFVGFGPDRLALEPVPLHRVQAARVSGLRVRIREQCPRRPGVYAMADARNEIIYIGKAKSLRARLLGYFRPRSRDPKAGAIVKEAAAIVWEPQPSEFA